jgi:hypothetical protein
MYSLTIELTDYVTPRLAALRRAIAPDRLNAIAGRAAVNLIKQHLRDRDAETRNKLGGPRSHYFNDAADATNFQPAPGGVVVQISQPGIRMKFEGGVIKPVNSKALTIAACAEAYGKRAREFDNLVLVWPKGANRGWLEEAPSQDINVTSRKRKSGERSYKVKPGAERGGKIMFWLVSKATITTDPTVIPDPRDIEDEVSLRLISYIDRQDAAQHGVKR